MVFTYIELNQMSSCTEKFINLMDLLGGSPYFEEVICGVFTEKMQLQSLPISKKLLLIYEIFARERNMSLKLLDYLNYLLESLKQTYFEFSSLSQRIYERVARTAMHSLNIQGKGVSDEASEEHKSILKASNMIIYDDEFFARYFTNDRFICLVLENQTIRARAMDPGLFTRIFAKIYDKSVNGDIVVKTFSKGIADYFKLIGNPANFQEDMSEYDDSVLYYIIRIMRAHLLKQPVSCALSLKLYCSRENQIQEEFAHISEVFSPNSRKSLTCLASEPAG